MDSKEAIQILTQHQEWRLGSEQVYIYTPKQITQAINIVLEIANKNTIIDIESNKYNVWVEGFATNGQQGTAQFLGNYTAESFKTACKLALIEKGYSMNHYREDTNSYWGCKLYDNGTDATKSFG
tara:strand:- start:480 stop:854 length:375 start_codon:yes stop_codon:yes gene_type:complete